MGTGRGRPKAGTKAKKKWFKKNIMDWKRRTKDIDQIQDELKALKEGKMSMNKFVDEDVTGGGIYTCVPCSRSFITEAVLKEHERSKLHKKRVKLVNEEQYTQKEADAGAGMSS